MSKLKSPFLSLASQGTVGNALTTQRRGQDTIVRSKPIPTDPYSLAQAYQRWDYQDYAHLWTLLSTAEQRTWHTTASRYHMTGFAYWMRVKLNTLPDIAGRWHLDILTGGLTPDSSKHENHGVVFGSYAARARINRGAHFDGINDRIDLGNKPAFKITDTISIEAFIYPLGNTARAILGVYKAVDDRSYFGLMGGGQLRLWAARPTQEFYLTTTKSITNGICNHFLYNGDGTNFEILINGIDALTTKTGDPHFVDWTTDEVLHIGMWSTWQYPFDGLIDELVIRTRTLDLHEVKKHMERSYPV